MPNVAIYNISGAKVGEMELSENIFGQELNVPAMHAYVKAYLANQRQGNARLGSGPEDQQLRVCQQGSKIDHGADADEQQQWK